MSELHSLTAALTWQKRRLNELIESAEGLTRSIRCRRSPSVALSGWRRELKKRKKRKADALLFLCVSVQLCRQETWQHRALFYAWLPP